MTKIGLRIRHVELRNDRGIPLSLVSNQFWHWLSLVSNLFWQDSCVVHVVYLRYLRWSDHYLSCLTSSDKTHTQLLNLRCSCGLGPRASFEMLWPILPRVVCGVWSQTQSTTCFYLPKYAIIVNVCSLVPTSPTITSTTATSIKDRLPSPTQIHQHRLTSTPTHSMSFWARGGVFLMQQKFNFNII